MKLSTASSSSVYLESRAVQLGCHSGSSGIVLSEGFPAPPHQSRGCWNDRFDLPCGRTLGSVLFFLIILICALISARADAAEPTAIAPAGQAIHLAVMPLERLTPRRAPYPEIRTSLINWIVARGGARVLGDEAMEKFMHRHRIRYTGGIDGATARALRQEEGVDAVLITSLEFYDENYPPKIGILSRLVSIADEPVILWMDSIGLAGNDEPGILGLGLIGDIEVLREKVLQRLSGSLARYLSGQWEPAAGKVPRRYWPKIAYRDPLVQVGEKYTVAVVPFFNSALRKNAGEIMALHFLKELVQQGNLYVVEPGVIRQRLLNFRVIMLEGLSLSDSDAILNSLGADLALSGRAVDYVEYPGDITPKVDFSVVVLERMSKRTVWASKSYNQGDDGVFFFDRGRVYMTGTLASKMTRAVVEDLFGKRGTERREGAI